MNKWYEAEKLVILRPPIFDQIVITYNETEYSVNLYVHVFNFPQFRGVFVDLVDNREYRTRIAPICTLTNFLNDGRSFANIRSFPQAVGFLHQYGIADVTGALCNFDKRTYPVIRYNKDFLKLIGEEENV